MYRLSRAASRGLLPKTTAAPARISLGVGNGLSSTTRTPPTVAASTASTIRTLFASSSSKETYSSLEYPNATEPPEITKTIASQVRGQAPVQKSTTPLASLPDNVVTDAVSAETLQSLRARPLSPGVSAIAKEIPPEIPPNVPADQLETPETIVTTLDNGVRVVR